MENLDRDGLTLRLAALSPAKRALLEQKLRQSRAGDEASREIPRRVERGNAPLSFAQQRLWFMNQLEPHSSNYNEPSAMRLVGPLDVRALRAALAQLAARHDILRTTIGAIDGEPRQIIDGSEGSDGSATIDPEVVDLRATPDAHRDAAADETLLSAMARPFTLSSEPPVRFLVAQLDEQEFIALLVMHHSASDGWSTPILWRDLAALYGAELGVAAALPDMPIQYQDYAEWQRQRLRGALLDTQLAYWTNALEDVTPLNLPTDRKRFEDKRRRAGRAVLDLDSEIGTALGALGRQHDVTLFIVMLAAFETLLHRYCGQDDIVVGSPIAGRTRPELENLVGCFVNTLVLRLDFSNDPTFLQVLAQARDVTLSAHAHHDLPFERIVEALNPVRDVDALPLLRVLFALETAPVGAEFVGMRAKALELPSLAAKADVFVAVVERDEGLQVRAEFASELFDASSIERMLAHFSVLLRSITAHPERRVSDLALMTEAERHQLLVDWNGSAACYPRDASVHELFEHQARQSPDAVAVMCGDRRYTYRELDERANQLGHYLRTCGVTRGAPVAVCLTRSMELLVALLGVLKAGGAYVPLDADYPVERLQFILEDTRTCVVLTETVLGERVGMASLGRETVLLDRDWATIANESTEGVPSTSEAEDLAYVMYTSGSTGRAKGVEIVHRGIVRLVFGGGYAQLDPGQTILHLAPVAFDASTFEIWGSLLHGGTCVICPDRVPSMKQLGDLLRAQSVSTLWLTASMYNTVIDVAPETLRGVKQLLIGGEALSVAHVRRGLDLLPTTQIINGYGPTESTTFACCYPIPRDLDARAGSIPIGRPIGNTTAYVLDRRLNPLPVGVAGELYIGGDGLGRGYLNDAPLTAAKFIASPFGGVPTERLYRTGDVVRYLASGDIEFIGRTDDQVKIRGHRIEPGEISAVLREHPEVQDAAVVTHEAADGAKRLAAYVVYRPGADSRAVDVCAFLRRKLPEHLIPWSVTPVSALPVTANGKLDRRALPAPEPSPAASGTTDAAQARTTTEATLADIWASVLGLERVGIRDNFFDLGGHSMLVVRLFARINRVMGKDVPLSTLFRAPTIEQLAAALDSEDGAARESCVVPVHTRGTRPPFFWIHGDGSDAFLPRYLGPDQPFYCFDHQSQDGKPARLTTVEAIAKHYLDEIRKISPHGPYYLGGYSFGGLVALDVARQLTAQAEQVAFLALLDPTSALGETRSPRVPWRVRWKRGDLKDHLRSRIEIGLKRAVATLHLALGCTLPRWVRIQYIVDVYRQASVGYSMPPYSGRAVLFRGEGRSDAVWRRWESLLTGHKEVFDVAGGHDDLRRECHVRRWAEDLAASLTAAQPEQSSASQTASGQPTAEPRRFAVA